MLSYESHACQSWGLCWFGNNDQSWNKSSKKKLFSVPLKKNSNETAQRMGNCMKNNKIFSVPGSRA